MSSQWVRTFNVALLHYDEKRRAEELFFGVLTVELGATPTVRLTSERWEPQTSLRANPLSYRALELRVERAVRNASRWRDWPAVQAQMTALFCQF